MKTDAELHEFLKPYKRLIEDEVRRYSTHLPESIVMVEAYKLAKNAAKAFDPKTGNKFTTYLVNSLKKLSRLSTQYGSDVRMPEDKQFKLQKVNMAFEELTHNLGREPSVAEISEHTGFGIKHVNDLLHGRVKNTTISKLDFAPIIEKDQFNNEWVHFVYHDLPPRDKLIFEFKTGFGNKPVLDNASLAKKLKTSQTTIVQRTKIIGDLIQKGLRS